MSSTVYLIAVNAPLPIMSESANGLFEVFVFVKSAIISSTKSTMLSLNSISTALNKKLFLKSVYAFLEYCRDLIMLCVLSHNKLIASGDDPECFKNLLA